MSRQLLATALPVEPAGLQLRPQNSIALERKNASTMKTKKPILYIDVDDTLSASSRHIISL